MRDKLFQWIARVTYKRYGLVFVICLALTVFFGVFAEKIRIETTWRALIPKDNPATKNFEKILEEFGTATQIVVAIEGPDKERIIEAAHTLVPLIENLTAELPVPGNPGSYEIKNVIKRVDMQFDSSFIATHGFMLEKAVNLEKNAILFTDYNLVPFITHINDVLESQYVQDTDNLTKQEKTAVRGLDGMYQFMDALHAFAKGTSQDAAAVQRAVDGLTIGDGYYLSTDKKMLLMFLTPTMTVDEIDAAVAGVNKLEETVQKFNGNNPDIHIGLTGMHVVVRDEMEAGMSDTYRNLVMALTVILLVFIISFRMVSGPVLAMIVLMAGIIWDIGLAYLVIGRLNIFTAVCSVILLGLGVDYAIHIISAYTEFRHKGKSVEDALSETYARIGTGLVTGSVTTAVAFLALTLTSYPAFQEFGFVVGTGILCCLVVSLFFLPSLLVIKEKLWSLFRKNYQPKQVDLEFKALGWITGIIAAYPKSVIAATAALTLMFIVSSSRVEMNRNYMDMEPEGLESIRLQREIPKRFNISPDNMMVLVDSMEEADRLTDLLNERTTIGLVESIADYMPAREKQMKRALFIREIYAAQSHLPVPIPIDKSGLIEQLYRFNDNLIEMSSLAFISGLDKVFDKTNYYLGLDEEGDQVGINHVLELIDIIENSPEPVKKLELFQREFIPAMTRRVFSMADSDPVTIDMVPEHIRERFVSENGLHFLVNIYANRDIWDGLFTGPFLESVIRNVPGVTGSPVFMKEMVRTAKEEGIFALTLAFIAILIILLVDFRRITVTLAALLPLCLALVWMVGIMGLTGFKFSIINVIGLPLVLGIGIDDGVHIIHRYRIEGKEKLTYAIASIGKAITLTSITTILGFGSLIPSVYRGYASLGILVTLGVGLCYVTSVFILPTILHKFIKTW